MRVRKTARGSKLKNEGFVRSMAKPYNQVAGEAGIRVSDFKHSGERDQCRSGTRRAAWKQSAKTLGEGIRVGY